MGRRVLASGAMRGIAATMLAVYGLGQGGCGYVLYGERQRITIVGPPPGSIVTDGLGNVLGQAPGELRVPHHQNFMLFIDKPGYRQGRVFLARKSGWGVILMDVFLTACIGLIVDLKKGTWAAFAPDEFHVEMPPEPASK